MTRLAIGMALGFIGLLGMGIGGGLDHTPMDPHCQNGCGAPYSATAMLLTECADCPDEG